MKRALKDVTVRMKVRDARSSSMKDATAHLVRGERPSGYLWIPDADGGCHGWIDDKQMDKLAMAWCRYRGFTPTTQRKKRHDR